MGSDDWRPNRNVSRNCDLDDKSAPQFFLQWSVNHAAGSLASAALAQVIPLLQLQDGHAPYKGIWTFEQIQLGRVEATHATYGHEGGPACVIETQHFEARETASRFVGHLVAHGWGVLDLQPEGECLVYPSTSRS